MKILKKDFNFLQKYYKIKYRMKKKDIKRIFPNLDSSFYKIPVFFVKKENAYSFLRLWVITTRKGNPIKRLYYTSFIVISPKHIKPRGNLIATLAHEYAHFYEIKYYNNYTHNISWLKTFMRICPQKFWKYETLYIKRRYMLKMLV